MFGNYGVEAFCKESPDKIENFEDAKSSNDFWVIHHRFEEMGLTKQDLIDLGMYYHRPACELIFMERRAHIKLHRTTLCSSEHNKKIGEKLAGRVFSEESLQLMRKKHKPLSEETRRKMSESHKGKKPNNFGHKRTEEQKRKTSESLKAVWAKKKGEIK